MPNITPSKHRALYEIYPDSASLKDPGGRRDQEIAGMLKTIGREVQQGRHVTEGKALDSDS